MLGHFSGCISTKQRIKCLAQGHNTVPWAGHELANLKFSPLLKVHVLKLIAQIEIHLNNIGGGGVINIFSSNPGKTTLDKG